MNDNPTRPCGRCGDTDRFNDNGDSVCSTCGLTRRGAATAPDAP